MKTEVERAKKSDAKPKPRPRTRSASSLSGSNLKAGLVVTGWEAAGGFESPGSPVVPDSMAIIELCGEDMREFEGGGKELN